MSEFIQGFLENSEKSHFVYDAKQRNTPVFFSGVPKPNGKRHASEIASLSLDILEHVNRMEIPHIPGTNVRLRIGCHSGTYILV